MDIEIKIYLYLISIIEIYEISTLLKRGPQTATPGLNLCTCGPNPGKSRVGYNNNNLGSGDYDWIKKASNMYL